MYGNTKCPDCETVLSKSDAAYLLMTWLLVAAMLAVLAFTW